MTLHIEYLTDRKGKHKAVVIPNHEWKKFSSEFEKMKNKLSILLGIQTAMREVREIQGGKKKAKSLSDFLNEI